jgi:hypothetical protein
VQISETSHSEPDFRNQIGRWGVHVATSGPIERSSPQASLVDGTGLSQQLPHVWQWSNWGVEQGLKLSPFLCVEKKSRSIRKYMVCARESAIDHEFTEGTTGNVRGHLQSLLGSGRDARINLVCPAWER